MRPGPVAGAALYPALSAKRLTVALNLGLDPARPLRFAPPWQVAPTPPAAASARPSAANWRAARAASSASLSAKWR